MAIWTNYAIYAKLALRLLEYAITFRLSFMASMVTFELASGCKFDLTALQWLQPYNQPVLCL